MRAAGHDRLLLGLKGSLMSTNSTFSAALPVGTTREGSRGELSSPRRSAS